MLTAEEARRAFYFSIKEKYRTEIEKAEVLILEAYGELKREVVIPFEDKEAVEFVGIYFHNLGYESWINDGSRELTLIWKAKDPYGNSVVTFPLSHSCQYFP